MTHGMRLLAVLNVRGLVLKFTPPPNVLVLAWVQPTTVQQLCMGRSIHLTEQDMVPGLQASHPS